MNSEDYMGKSKYCIKKIKQIFLEIKSETIFFSIFWQSTIDIFRISHDIFKNLYCQCVWPVVTA